MAFVNSKKHRTVASYPAPWRYLIRLWRVLWIPVLLILLTLWLAALGVLLLTIVLFSLLFALATWNADAFPNTVSQFIDLTFKV